MSTSDNAIPYPDGEFWAELSQLYLDAFSRSTHRAVGLGREFREPYRSVLKLLEDCPTPDEPSRDLEWGATYKQLAFIAHRVGMSKEDRQGWYELARRLPLSGAHAGHLITKLDDRDEIADLENLFYETPSEHPPPSTDN